MERPPREHLGRTIALVVGIVVVAGLGFAFWRGMVAYSTPPPEFPLLTDDPDPALHGTVAYFDSASSCVRLIAASGAASKEVYCLGDEPLGEGPALAWLPDGHLEMIMYDWPPEEPIRPRWRRIVDVITLAVETASLEGVPDEPVHLDEPVTSPDGARILTTVEGGRILITVEDAAGTRELMDAKASPEYHLPQSYPMWSPDWQWLLADDGRLVIMTVEASSVRTLVATGVGFPSSGIAAVAITAEDLLIDG